jgi:E3 ubiquitin-protein ligase MARCH6
METSWDEMSLWPSHETRTPNNLGDNTSHGARMILVTLVDLAEPYFASLGMKVRVGAGKLETTWKRLALGHGPAERTFAVFLGYAVVGFLLAVYLNILTVGNVKSAGRAVRSAVRQQLLIVKVSPWRQLLSPKLF